ncbi:MAG: hypothetical protein KJN68_01110 [Bacteroidia bacterium]|nr:hypothetical protein [Bacteroidia bacterium]
MKTKKNETLNNVLSKKYRLTDVLLTDKKRRTIQQLIDKSPMYLWNKIHAKHSNVSLVRVAYAKLKAKVAIKRPDLVKKTEKEFEAYKAKKRLLKEQRNGTLGSSNSRFKKVSSKLVNK